MYLKMMMKPFFLVISILWFIASSIFLILSHAIESMYMV